MRHLIRLGVIAGLLTLWGYGPLLAQDRSSVRTITKTSTITRTIDHDWSKLFSGIAWPLAILCVVLILIWNLEKIGKAIRGAPFLRRIAVGPIEIELDRSQLEKLKESTEKTFADLLKKTNAEMFALRDSALIDYKLEAAAKSIIKEKFRARTPGSSANLRFTAYVSDVVFRDFLYQLTSYYFPPQSNAAAGGGPGRRFSQRYGIIGLSWRTETSRGVGEAFHGTTEEIRQLIEDWSMSEAEAEHARRKPSCLAIVARDTKFNKPVGLIYADGEEKNLFGQDTAAKEFAIKCEDLPETRELADALLTLQSFSSQIKLDFDLTKVDSE